MPGVLVIVGDEVQLALPDARQGAVGAAQQEGAHVCPGQAAVVGRVGCRHLALERREQLERLGTRVAPVAPIGLVPGSLESKYQVKKGTCNACTTVYSTSCQGKLIRH